MMRGILLFTTIVGFHNVVSSMPDMNDLKLPPDFDMSQFSSQFGMEGMGGGEDNKSENPENAIPMDKDEFDLARPNDEVVNAPPEKQEKHEFMAEVTRLMDIIVNSLYTQKEVFLRELLSNAADALEKARYQALTDDRYKSMPLDFTIKVDYDTERGTVSIRDYGIGMTRADMISHLGTVAKSGTSNFLEALSQGTDVNLIGQFGVGFYSAFLVADRVQVISKSNDDDQYIWTSSADKTFTITKDPRGNTLKRGTMVLLHLKEDSRSFLEYKTLKELAIKYSQFVAFPIYLRNTRTTTVEIEEPKECCAGGDTSCCADMTPPDCCSDSQKDHECCDKQIKKELCCERHVPCCDDSTDGCCDTCESDLIGCGDDEECKKKHKKICDCCELKRPCCEDDNDCCDSETTDCCEGEDKDDECCEKQKKREKCCELKKPRTKKVERQVDEWMHVNQQKAIWLRNKDDVTESEHVAFYKSLTNDYSDPLTWIHFSAEGEVEFRAVLYIPSRAPMDLFENYFQKPNWIKLYVRRVLVADKVDEIVPKYLHFIRGVVDSDDLPLNVSRENLQQHKVIKAISSKLQRKSLELIRKLAKDSSKEKEDMEKDAKEETDEAEKKKKFDKLKTFQSKYDKFYSQFSRNLKLGCYEDDTNRARIVKLLRFQTSTSDKKGLHLEEFVESLPKDTNVIYYASGESADTLMQSPQMQVFLNKKIPVLFCVEAMDEPCLQKMVDFEGKRFESIQKADLEIQQTPEEKDNEEKIKKKFQPLITHLQESLRGKVMKVEISRRLVTDPCAIVSSKWGQSAYMEKVMKTQTFADPSQMAMMKGNRVFEINPRHIVIQNMLDKVLSGEKDEIKSTINTLFQVATVASGFDLETPTDLSSAIYGMMTKNMGADPNDQVQDVDVSDISLDGKKDGAKSMDDEAGDEEAGDDEAGDEAGDDVEEEL